MKIYYLVCLVFIFLGCKTAFKTDSSKLNDLYFDRYVEIHFDKLDMMIAEYDFKSKNDTNYIESYLTLKIIKRQISDIDKFFNKIKLSYQNKESERSKDTFARMSNKIDSLRDYMLKRFPDKSYWTNHVIKSYYSNDYASVYKYQDINLLNMFYINIIAGVSEFSEDIYNIPRIRK